MSRKEQIIDSLNKLYNLNLVAKRRFEEVAGHLYDLELKRICFENFEVRKRFALEIEEAIKGYDGTSKTYFNSDFITHDLWSDFRFLAGGLSSVEQFYEELEYYTRTSVLAYQEVINSPFMPPETAKMLRSHWSNLASQARVFKNQSLRLA